jgi:hypothetical protein
LKRVRVILSSEAEEVYSHLNQESVHSKIEKTILTAIKKKVELIKQNKHYGEPISKKLIPKEYITKYNVTNLFWVELPNFWRMLYTLTNGDSEIEIVSFVLDIVDHKKYNKSLVIRVNKRVRSQSNICIQTQDKHHQGQQEAQGNISLFERLDAFLL